MIHYKTFFRIIKSQKTTLIVLTVIFLSILIASNNVFVESNSEIFKEKSFNIMMLDEDNSKLSKSMMEYLQTLGNPKIIDKIDDLAKDEINIGDFEGILKLEKGFEESVLRGDSSKAKYYGGSHALMAASNAKLNTYLNTVYQYIGVGFSLDESIDKAKTDFKDTTKVNVYKSEQSNEFDTSRLANFSKISMIYIFYFCIMIFNVVFREIGKKEIYLRTLCSGSSANKVNIRMIVFSMFLIIFFIIFAIGISMLFNYTELMKNNFILFLFLNLLALGLVSLAISFFTASIFKNQRVLSTVNSFFTVILMFIGGVFVPIEIFPEYLKKISEFTPLYWFSVSNSTFNNDFPVTGVKLEIFSKGVFMQILFALVFITISLIIKNRAKSDIS